MSRLYTIQFSGVSIAAAQEVFTFNPASGRPIRLHSVYIGQSGTADAGDAQEEFLAYQILRGATTVGSGGGTVTPRPVDANDPAAGGTYRINDTTLASGGTAVVLHSHSFNVRVGLELRLPDVERYRTQNGALIVVRFPNAPADPILMYGTAKFAEV